MAIKLSIIENEFRNKLKEMENPSELELSSALSVCDQLKKAFESIHKHNKKNVQSINSSLANIVHANQHWQDLFSHATVSKSFIEAIRRTHQTWLDKLKSNSEIAPQLQATTGLAVGNMVYRLSISERLFAGIDLKSIQRAVALPKPVFLEFQNAISDITSPYKKLAESIHNLSEMTYLPAFAMPGATREVFTTGYAIDAIRIPDIHDDEEDLSVARLIAEVDQETSGCMVLLQAIEPALVKMYIGAIKALRGRNNDKKRHFLSSLREFWNHLLHQLAPDEFVLSWVPSGDKDFIHEGRPTRRARLHYLCRNISHEPLSKFVYQDTCSLLELLNVFNRMHELNPKLTDKQIQAILLRSNSWVSYILQICKDSR